MKRIYLYIAILGLSTPLFAASRLNPDEHHFVAVHGSVGYQGLLNSTNWLKPDLGVAPAVGISYRYLRNGFIMQVGLEGEYAYLTNRITNQRLQQLRVDSEGDEFTLTASFTNGRDYEQTASLYLPVTIGYEHKRFYGLAGARIGMCLYGNTHTQFALTTQATYDRFIDPFIDMPTHQLESNVPMQGTTQQWKWQSPSVRLHLELGARLDRPDEAGSIPTHNYRLYLGLFANYALLNQHANISTGSLISHTESSTPTNTWGYTIHPAMLSQQMLGESVHPLTIGIQFTCLFELPKKHKCMSCSE